MKSVAGRSLYREFKFVFVTIAMCVLFAATPAFILTELVTGSGGAINVSGSLRMMSYKLTVAVSNPYAKVDSREVATREAVEEFWERFTRPVLVQSIPGSPNDDIRQRYESVKQRFTEEIRPAALKSIHDENMRRQFMAEVGSFVSEVDEFVMALETRLSGRMRWLKAILFFVLVGAFGVTVLLLRVMRKRIFAPLEELEAAAKSVRRRNFQVRVRAASHDSEIGRFARGFNFMVSELERLYGSLEDEVESKTEDLNRRNQGLEFLARVSETLLVDGPELACAVKNALEGVVRLSNIDAARFIIKSANTEKNATSDVLASVGNGFEGKNAKTFLASGSDGRQRGELQVAFEGTLSDWQKNFLEMTAALIGRTIETSMRAMDNRRLAVLEERSTIARELHDSIAQSLSFSRIQLLRLKRALEKDPTGSLVREVLQELDEGVATAYMQLREVLTAFRLQLNGKGFSGAVASAVEAFRNRTGIRTEFQCSLLGTELSSNEQVHVVQILREALSNVEKHARAGSVFVRLEHLPNGGCLLSVADDGVGIPEATGKVGHFGLVIMKERAEALGAELSLTRRPEGGTLLTVIKHNK